MTLARTHATLRAPLEEALACLILPVSVIAITLSALLLFIVEPMFAKMALPALGGSPSVWSVAMVFFQAAMLLGYVYAHVVTKVLPMRVGALVHVALLGLAFLSLPVALRAGAVSQSYPALWLIGVFTVSVGLPFFALSAQGPLLQAWFARSGHPRANDPYFLYAASNIGSFAALIAYPFVIEPLFGLSVQAATWTIGFIVMAGLVAAVGFATSATTTPDDTAWPVAVTSAPAPRIAAVTFLKWIGLSAVPSGLMVSVTAHISTDIAATPLLWVIPLGLYLLSFIWTFRSRPIISDKALDLLLPVSATMVLMSMLLTVDSFVVAIVVHLVFFLISALVCQRALYRSRPDAGRLTVFYMAISLGGALGGLFAGLIAPFVFSSILEYPLLIAATLFCRPGLAHLLRETRIREYGRILVIAATGVLAEVFVSVVFDQPGIARYLVTIVFAALMLLDWRKPQITAFVGVLIVAHLAIFQQFFAPGESLRSFFGVNIVDTAMHGQFRILRHGTTLHGAERIRNANGWPYVGRPMPTAYYHPDGPIAQAVAAAREVNGGLNLSVIGLGAGAIACLTRPGENAIFYEIDPVVIRIATDPNRFRFLSACTPNARIVPGDGRLTLGSQEARSDAIVVDAFSSDAIPVHLLTREAFALYLSKLSDRGIVILHISNNTMDLRAIIARSAADLGLSTYVQQDFPTTGASDMRMASVVAVLTRDPAHLGSLLGEAAAWKKIAPNMASWPWTDDYSTILPAIWRR
jgi:hypothetical protein